MAGYSDGKLSTDDSELVIRTYYPWGAKRIRWNKVRSVKRFEMSALKGKWRIWGSGDFRHWYNLDTARTSKSTGFIVDLGGPVKPVVTPDHPDQFEQDLLARNVQVER